MSDRHDPAEPPGEGTARAVTFVGPRRVEVRAVPLPEPTQGQLLVRTAYSGISAGTEMLAYRGEVDPAIPLDETLPALSGGFGYPFRYGYSCVGRVERSRATLPEGTAVFAFHPHQDRFVLDASQAVLLGDVEPRVATLFPLVETALQVALDAGPVLEQPILVVGLGAVGIITAALLARAGARVIASEPLVWRRDAAAAFGIHALPPAGLDAAVQEETGGGGVPLVVEVSGNPTALTSALPLLAHEGTALVASWYGTKAVALPLGAEFHRRRLTLRSTQVSTIPARLAASWSVDRRRATARRLLGELPLGALATHEFPLAEAARAYAAVDSAEPALLHAALCYA